MPNRRRKKEMRRREIVKTAFHRRQFRNERSPVVVGFDATVGRPKAGTRRSRAFDAVFRPRFADGTSAGGQPKPAPSIAVETRLFSRLRKRARRSSFDRDRLVLS